MDTTENNMSPFAQKVQHGLALANRRLMELDTALNRTLIIGQQDGTYKEVTAKKLLKESESLSWWKENFK